MQAIVEKALQKSPSERFASAQLFLDALDEVEQIPARQRVMRTRAAMTVGAVAVLGFGLILGQATRSSRAPEAPQAAYVAPPAAPLATTGAPFVAPSLGRSAPSTTAQLKPATPRR
jgi:hypothetical protein